MWPLRHGHWKPSIGDELSSLKGNPVKEVSLRSPYCDWATRDQSAKTSRVRSTPANQESEALAQSRTLAAVNTKLVNTSNKNMDKQAGDILYQPPIKPPQTHHLQEHAHSLSFLSSCSQETFYQWGHHIIKCLGLLSKSADSMVNLPPATGRELAPETGGCSVPGSFPRTRGTNRRRLMLNGV